MQIDSSATSKPFCLTKDENIVYPGLGSECKAKFDILDMNLTLASTTGLSERKKNVKITQFQEVSAPPFHTLYTAPGPKAA